MARLALVALLLAPLPAAAQAGSAPVAQVRATLRGLGPEVQRCADLHGPWPNAGPRLRVRVWLEPNGGLRLEVPELEGRTDRTVPAATRVPLARMYGCLHLAVARSMRGHLRPFRGRRQKIERAFRVRLPGPPPPAAELARRVAGRRAQLLACVPGAGRGDPAELVVRATLATDGVPRLTGLAVPPAVPFEAATRCVSAELAQLQLGRVTAERPFEAVIRYRYTPLAAPAAE